jgi:hypothetical protein
MEAAISEGARPRRRVVGEVALVALEHGGTWHFRWTKAHGFGFERSVVVAQRRDEPLESFHARVQKALSSVRAAGNRIAVAALCVCPATTTPVIAPRFRIASALIADLSGNARRLILAASDDSPPVTGHLAALADALREAEGPHVVIDVCVGGKGAQAAAE